MHILHPILVSKFLALSKTMLLQKTKIFNQCMTKPTLFHTVKSVLNGHSKIDKTHILMTKGSLMKVKSIAECSPCKCKVATYNFRFSVYIVVRSHYVEILLLQIILGIALKCKEVVTSSSKSFPVRVIPF